MSNKGDFGFYGKGLDGYVHYKQSVDRIAQSGGSSSPRRRGNADDTEKPGIYFLGKRLAWWQVAILLLFCGGALFSLLQSAV